MLKVEEDNNRENLEKFKCFTPMYTIPQLWRHNSLPQLASDIYSLLISDTNIYLVLCELERRFYHHPDGFYMFSKTQRKVTDYFEDNILEDLCLTPLEFRLRFDQIGVRYKSYEEFIAEDDKFKNKYYCSIYNAKRGQSFYLRNNKLFTEHYNLIFPNKKISLGQFQYVYQNAMNIAKERALEVITEKMQHQPVSFNEMIEIYYEFLSDLRDEAINKLGIKIDGERGFYYEP